MSKKKTTNKRNRRTAMMKRRLVLFCTAISLLIGASVCGAMTTKAQDSIKEASVNYKYYKCIEIKAGDSLWDIAKTYRSEEHDSMQDYIAELKRLNHLTSDEIQSTQYLTVPYYDSEYK